MVHSSHSALRISLPLVLLTLFGAPAFLHAQEGPETEGTLHDPSLNREDSREFREAREHWLKHMHRADPGVNVEVLTEEVREAKRAHRAEKGASILGDGTSVSITPAITGSWSERGSRNQAGRTRNADIDFESGMVYVAADGGQVWRGTLAGENWTPLNDGHRFGGVRMLKAIRTGDRLRIVVVYGSVVQFSDDEGAHWNPSTGLDDIRRSGSFKRGVVTDGPLQVIYAVGNEYDFQDGRSYGVLYRSTDQGISFSKVFRFDNSRMADVWSPPGRDYAYVIHGDTLSKATPNGEIELLSTPINAEGGTPTNASQLYLRGYNDNNLYLLARGSGTDVYATADRGGTWIRTGTTTSLFDANSFAVSPSDPGFAISGGVEVLYTRDAGFTWDTVNKWGAYYGDPQNRLHADIPFIEFYTAPDNSEKILISTDGGLYLSEDGLRTVRNLCLSGLTNSQYYSVYTSRVDTNYVFAGAQDQGFQRAILDNGGVLDFTQTISGDYGQITSSDGGKSLWTNYPGFTMYYNDAFAENLRRGASHDFPTKGQLWIPPLIADPDTPSVSYMAGGRITSGTRLIRYKFLPTGDIKTEELPYDFSQQGGTGAISAIAISPVNSDIWYVVTDDNAFFVSTDRGRNWTMTDGFTAPDGHYFYGVAIVASKSQPGTVYIAGAGYSNPGVFVSHDYGATFEAIADGLPPTLVYDIDVSSDDNMIFAATAVGPYVYVADSNKWFDASGGIAPDQTYWSVDYIEENNVVRYGTYGRGIWDLRLDVAVSSVDRPGSPAATAAPRLTLSANRRSGTATTFELTVPVPGTVSLHVYDLAGKLVAILHNGHLEAGEHEFDWDGTATGGGTAPSGRYFCIAAGFGTAAYATAAITR